MWTALLLVTLSGFADGAGTAAASRSLVTWPLCKETNESHVQRVICNYSMSTLEGRNVYYQVPQGEEPKHGWPVVIIFHGWNLWAETSWNASTESGMGLLNKARLVRKLLMNGLAVVTPDAFWNDTTQDGGYWYSNIDPFNRSSPSDLRLWNASSPDHFLVMAILERMPHWGMNPGSLHCVGFSSGGYMASRMGANYDVCKTITIASGSFYYCDNDCPKPQPYYQNILRRQVPTLFLQGSEDDTVPRWTLDMYYRTLCQYRVPTRRVLQKRAGHQWLDAAPAEILRWVQTQGADASCEIGHGSDDSLNVFV